MGPEGGTGRWIGGNWYEHHTWDVAEQYLAAQEREAERFSARLQAVLEEAQLERATLLDGKQWRLWPKWSDGEAH